MMNDRFQRINSKMKQGVYLYGAGVNGRWVYDFCRRNGIKVLAFIDSDPAKHGTVIDGVPCISYDVYQEREAEAADVLITAKQCVPEIYNKHRNNQYIMSFDAWFAEKYESKYRSIKFEDEQSYASLNAIIQTMKTADNHPLWETVNHDQYFGVPPFHEAEKTYVDLGAYTGDTIERYINYSLGMFDTIYAFEPGERQRVALMKRVKRLNEEWALDEGRVIVENMCVGDMDGLTGFDDNGKMGNNMLFQGGNNIKNVITLDTYFENKKVGLITSDIEGSDYAAICGAEKLIRRCKPKLAVSVYHMPDDLFRVYRFIDRLRLGYKFKLRIHQTILTDVVLYCYTEHEQMYDSDISKG